MRITANVKRMGAILLLGLPLTVNGAVQDKADSDLTSLLAALDINASDLAIPVDNWDTRLKLSNVEFLLKNPLYLPWAAEKAPGWLQKAYSPVDVIGLTGRLLDIPPPDPIQAVIGPDVPRTPGVPNEIISRINRIVQTQRRAQVLLKKSVQSLSPEQRVEASRVWSLLVTNQTLSPDEQESLLKATSFDLVSLGQAASLLAKGIEPELQKFEGLAGLSRQRWHLPEGDVVISGLPEDHFTSEDLQSVILLVRAGQKTVYEGAVAAANEGEIRIAIDTSDDVEVVHKTSPAAGVGLFGIGLFYLPNEKGSVRIESGDFSQGAGFFGVGGLLIRGQAKELLAGGFAQGAGVFGTGYCVSGGTRSLYQVSFAGQGFGSTRGAGVFIHRGDSAQIMGGLRDADPRDPLGLSSLSQGVGYGPRATAGGGVGLALIEGNHNQLESSYFAQGSGYWHSIGVCVVIGQENRLQARRYSQGSGVHTGAGIMSLRGNKNQTLNWGVGPTYGWDYGIGTFVSVGNENHFQADWGSGHGEQNGHSFSLIRGNENRLLLPAWGTGTQSRRRPSYALALCQGQGNRFRVPTATSAFTVAGDLQLNPWGVIHSSAPLLLDPALRPVEVTWSERESKKSPPLEPGDSKRVWPEKAPVSDEQRLRTALFMASLIGMDSKAGAEALKQLYSLPTPQALSLVNLVNADRVEDYFQLRPLLSAFGADAGPLIRREIKRSEGTRRVLLISQLGFGRAQENVEMLVTLLRERDSRVRRVVAATLGHLFSVENGRMIGRRRLMALARDTAHFKEQRADRGTDQTLSELLGVLSLNPSLPGEDRWSMVETNGEPNNPARPATWDRFAVLVASHSVYTDLLIDEEKELKGWEDRVHRTLEDRLGDEDTEVKAAAIIAIGQMGRARDAHLLQSYFTSTSASIREAAANAMAALGPAAFDSLQEALHSSDIRSRQTALLACAQSPELSVQRLLLTGFKDSEASVRRMALASLSQVFSMTPAFHQELESVLRELSVKDPNPQVRDAARYRQVSGF